MPKIHGSFNVPAGTCLSFTCFFGPCIPGQMTQHRLALAQITRFLPLVSIFSEGFRQWTEYASSRNACCMRHYKYILHKYLHNEALTSTTHTSPKSLLSTCVGVSCRKLLLESSSCKFGGSLALYAKRSW